MVPVLPGRSYQFGFEYRTKNIAPNSGLQWHVYDVASSLDLLRNSRHVSSDVRKREQLDFRTPDNCDLVRVILAYERAPGTTRIEGSLQLWNVRLRFC
jgi:hypothetical protein